MRDFDTKLLRSFLSVAAERNFSKAAERLACSQATMSQRIRQLEESLGITLFQREYRDVVLTPAGSELLRQAQKVIDEHDSFLNLVHKGQETGNVRIGIAEDYVLPMLPKLLKRVRHVYPGIDLSVITGLSRNLHQQVEARSLDLSVVTLPDRQPEALLLAEPELRWAVAPGFRPVANEPWPVAFFPEGCAFRFAATACLLEAGLSYQERLVSASGQVIQAAVSAEMAVTVMASGTIPLELVPAPDSFGLPPLSRTYIQIIEREQGLSGAAQKVKELVAETF